jgi:DNA repair exonuclease SbcCD ATPase subunit
VNAAVAAFAAGPVPAGISPPSSPEGRTAFLSDVIVELGFADQATVEQAVRTARSPGTTVAQVLVETGAITEGQLAQATAERHGLAYLDLDAYDPDPSAANLLAPAAARRYRCVPVGFLGQRLLVAMADPADALGVNDVTALTGFEVVPAVATGSAIEDLVERLPLPGGDPPPAPAPAPVEAPETGPSPPLPVLEPLAVAEVAGMRRELDAVRARLAEATAELERARAGATDAAELRSRLAAADSEREELLARAAERDRELQSARTEVEARSLELTALRDKLTAAETGAVRVRAEADAKDAELKAARARTEAAERAAEEARLAAAEGRSEAEEARGRANQAERAAREARVRVDELHAADRRAEQARLALSALREESERERELLALELRDLRAKATSEERRRRMLEERLSEVEGGVFAAERAFEELRQAQRRMRGSLRALSEPELPDEG